MANLLTLPRELRDAICYHATQNHWSPSSTASIAQSHETDEGHFFDSEHNKWQPISLLSVNQQIRQEIQDLIHKRRPIQLQLNIKARGYIYTPFWTHLNYLLRPHDALNLHVNLTIHSTEAFRRNDGWPRQPGQIFRALLHYLSRFIFRGPSFLDGAPPFETLGPHFIEVLSVHVEFDDWYTSDTWPETVHEIFRMCKALAWLDTAHRYVGNVKVSTAYRRKGEDIARKQEWEVKTGLEARFSALREEDWARTGFYFGEAWLQRNSALLVPEAGAGAHAMH